MGAEQAQGDRWGREARARAWSRPTVRDGKGSGLGALARRGDDPVGLDIVPPSGDALVFAPDLAARTRIEPRGDDTGDDVDDDGIVADVVVA